MSRHAKRIKTSHDSTAAYAASQPLFDALRLGAERATEQRALLAGARDIVQQTHVKLADAIADGEQAPQAQYMGSVVRAWQAATESFADIFHALAQATAAVPSEGKEAREGHAEFVTMAASAAEASGVVRGCGLFRDREDEQDGESESASDAEAQSNRPGANAAQLPLPLSKGNKKDAKARQRIEESRHKREKKLLALRAKMKQSQGRSPPNTTDSVPVEYEDVSAEVQARLKAKEAKREAAKREKKRKRESGESLKSGAASAENERKPARKKGKADGVVDGGEGDVVAKRKQDGSMTAEVGDGRRKRAKTGT